MTEQNKKVINKVSVSLINKLLWYKKFPEEKNLQSLSEAVEGIYKQNFYTKRGNSFEDEVNEGKHGKISQLFMPLKQQIWCRKYFDFDGLNLKMSGKLDAISDNGKVIYDLKRVNKYYKDAYDDESTCQHIFYFYLRPEATDFYYVIAAGKDSENLTTHIVHKKRPSADELESKVIWYINEFFKFLKQHGLFEKYKEKQIAKR